MMLQVLDVLFLVFIASTGFIVGTAAVFVSKAFNKRILQDLGLDEFPTDPVERNQLIIERCSYVRTWTHLDSFYVVVMGYGLLLLLAAVITSAIEMSIDQVLRIHLVPFVYPLTLTSFILITISLILLLQRFLFISRLHLHQENMNKKIPGVHYRKPSVPGVSSKQMPITAIVISSLAALVGGLSFYVIEHLGHTSFFIMMGCYVLIAASVPIWEYNRIKKKDQHSK
jgi:hypothetical protein